MTPAGDILAAAPPLAAALAALAFVVPWQLAGTALLAPLLRRSGVPPAWSLLLGWFLWLPLCGTLAELVAVAGVASPALFRGLTGAVAVSALVVVLRALGARPRLPAWPRLGWGWSPVCAVVLLQLLTLIFAAHPQRLYDQLSYHLVVAKRALAFGSPYVRLYDPHLVIAGPVEYAFIWPRALWGSDFFQLASAQAWIYLAAVIPSLGAAGLAARAAPGRYRLWAWLAVAAAVPGLLPNNELVHIAKPGALLFAGAFLIFVAGFVAPELYFVLAVALSMLLVGANPTFVHVAIGLAAALALDRWRRRTQAAVPWTLPALGGACLGASLLRSWVVTGTFLYPADARFLRTPFADDVTLGYWRYIAFGSGESFAERWSGPVRVLGRSPALATWVGLGVVALAVVRWRGRAAAGGPPAALGDGGGWLRLFAFVAAYAAVWPCFYDGFIYSRFVAGYVAAAVAAAFFATLAAPGRVAAALAAVGVVGGLSSSSADVMARKLLAWNRGSLAAEFAEQYPRYVAMQRINTWAAAGDTVLSDGPEKLFLAAASLSGAISPQERQAWDALTADPRGAARALGVQAVVIEAIKRGRADDQRPFVGPVYDVFERLAPFGQIVAVGPDLVLGSACYFQALPCPPGP